MTESSFDGIALSVDSRPASITEDAAPMVFTEESWRKFVERIFVRTYRPGFPSLTEQVLRRMFE